MQEEFNYQEETLKTAIFPKQHEFIYPTLGLAGEAGEVADKVKKILRDNNGQFDDVKRHDIALELGDVMWYVAVLSHELGYTLTDIEQMNIDKLKSRQQRNQLHGSGDNR